MARPSGKPPPFGAQPAPAGRSTRFQPHDLPFLAIDAHDIANRLAEQRPRHWRNMRDRALRRVGLVLANNGPDNHLAVLAFQFDRHAEPYGFAVRLGTGAFGPTPPCLPVLV